MADYSFDRQDLLRVLKVASCGLSVKRSVVPVFDMFCIHDDRCITYNDVIGVISYLEEPCGLKVLLPGDALLKLMSGYSASKVKISSQGEIRCGRSSATLDTMEVSAWPWFGAEGEDKLSISIPIDSSFIAGLKAVMISMTYTDSVPSFTGVTLEQVGSSVQFFSTNRKALSCFSSSLSKGMVKGDLSKPITLPPVFCEHLVSVWDQLKDEVPDAHMHVFPDHVVAWFGEEAMLFSRLLYVEKPQLHSKILQDYLGGQPVMPTQVPDEFRNVVDRLVSLSCEKMVMDKTGSSLSVKSQGVGVSVQERLSWDTKGDLSKSISIDVSVVKKALSECDQLDLRGDADRFLVFSKGDQFTHYTSCARGE